MRLFPVTEIPRHLHLSSQNQSSQALSKQSKLRKSTVLQPTNSALLYSTPHPPQLYHQSQPQTTDSIMGCGPSTPASSSKSSRKSSIDLSTIPQAAEQPPPCPSCPNHADQDPLYCYPHRHTMYRGMLPFQLKRYGSGSGIYLLEHHLNDETDRCRPDGYS